MKNKITVAGELILDIAPEFKGKAVERVEQILIPGRAILMGDCNIYPGALSNTALALKKLGADVKLIGRIGKDDYGRVYRDKIEEQQIEANLIEDDKSITPYSIGLSVPGVDRMFLYNPGAANHFRESDVSNQDLEESQILHFGYPTAMHYMFINDGEESVYLLKRAKEKGVVTSMDICFIDEQEEGPRQNWERILKNCCPYLDIFAPSIEELMYYLERSKHKEMLKQAKKKDYLEIIDLEKDVRPLADKLITWGCNVVIIKCGKLGIYIQTAKREQLYNMKNRIAIDIEEWAGVKYMQPAFQVERVLSAAGAGDAAIAAFLISLASGRGWKRCIQIAAAAGARCVMSYDSFSALLSVDEIEEMINTGWKVID